MWKGLKKYSKTIAVILVFIMGVGSASTNPTKADWEKETPTDASKIITPSISAETVNGTDVLITIEPVNEEIDTYEIWIEADIGYEAYKVENISRYYCYNADLAIFDNYGDQSGDYFLADLVTATGFEEKQVTIKNLPEGEVFVKVRAGKGDRRSDCSESQRVEITSGKRGYKSKYNFSKVKVGDTIKFGTYEKDFPADGRDPIEWVVLEKRKDRMLVVSKYCIESMPYDIEKKSVTWETCTLRKWLNDEFYKVAFNTKEKKLIRTTTLKNYNNATFGTFGGNDTKDKVFLLSERDVMNEKYGFNSWGSIHDINRRCAPTDFAIAQALLKGREEEFLTKDNDYAYNWWLRTPGYLDYEAAFVADSGGTLSGGDNVNSFMICVRPAMWIKIEDKTKKKK